MIDSFLVADPPLKQVVAHTVEAGLRGGGGRDIRTGLLTWGLGVFRTLSDDDIIQVTSAIGVNNFGFFQNAGQTLRQGIEAKLEYRLDRWDAYANYTYVDATYRSAITLSSPNNPNALTDPNNDDVQFVNVKPGDHIPGIPARTASRPVSSTKSRMHGSSAAISTSWAASISFAMILTRVRRGSR